MAGRNAICSILFSDDPFLTDINGCVLPDGHSGPHEFVDQRARVWQWETDLECDCEHCRECEGDYCTTYWQKPAAQPNGGTPT